MEEKWRGGIPSITMEKKCPSNGFPLSLHIAMVDHARERGDNSRDYLKGESKGGE